MIPPQIEANDLERARIEQLQTDLALAETPSRDPACSRRDNRGWLPARQARDETVRQRAQRRRSLARRDSRARETGQTAWAEGGAPLRLELSNGLTLLVGKNSRQNEEVTFRQASPNDLWLHARGVPGAHVIVKSGGRPVPDPVLREAAALAAYYSQSREATSVPVDYTEQRYVRHIKGGGPGMVTYEREHTLHVAPEDLANV